MNKLAGKKGLVFEGGGTAGIAHVGVLQQFKKMNIYDNFTYFAGSSAGAIIAGALACKATVNFIENMLFNMDFNNFKDDSYGIIRDIYRLTEYYGWYKGDALEEWYGNALQKLTGNKDITLKEAANKYKTYLVITMTDVRTSGLYTIYADHNSHPNLKLKEAIRRSAGIPLYFQAKFEETNDGIDHIYVDGGVLDNLPMKPLYNIIDKNEVLGIKLINSTELNKKTKDKLDMSPVSNIITFIEVLIDGIRDQALKYHVSSGDWTRTMQVDVLGYSATDFDLTIDDKNKLLSQGRKAVKNFIS